MKFTLKPNAKQLADIYKKVGLIEQNLIRPEGFVCNYVLTIGNSYIQAVISGMGSTITGTTTLKEFLGSSQSVNWRPNAKQTLKLKEKNGWSLSIWKASGETENATKVLLTNESTGIDMFAGIDGSQFPEAYAHAYLTEFGGVASGAPNANVNGRALFTLLNDTLISKKDIVQKGILLAIQQEIIKAGWGS